MENLRANQVDQKHRELDLEENLQNLYNLMIKIVFEHRKMIQQMNMDRWTSGVLTLQRHLVPKFQETKQSWFEARSTFKEMVDMKEADLVESAEEEPTPKKEAPKPVAMMDEDEDQPAYPVPAAKQEKKE